ncbi:hypothetical protein BDV95DRAFT_320452 [Massariosphaeria phaeospora]|uniref:Uncharacterized protein n=1 Tax=Massariosphaeria phaeospora TaxID=100035 RepID=A0A7C8MC21_9PLEO|nr:hypothetical protein BDV95DRAFT_320452 [Massariosphaeria phaeospora]
MRGSRHPRAPSPTNTPPPTPSLTGNPTVDNWLQLFTENEIDNMYRDFAPLLSRNSRQMLRSNEERALDSSNASSREPAASSVRSVRVLSTCSCGWGEGKRGPQGVHSHRATGLPATQATRTHQTSPRPLHPLPSFPVTPNRPITFANKHTDTAQKPPQPP